MSIITISRGSYSRGKEVAENVAQRLGYECIAREALLEASEQFNTDEIKMLRAIHDAPSIFDRISGQKNKYIAHIQTALLRQVRKDNVVYHGLAGQFLLPGISHVLKVRVIANLDSRVQLEMERTRVSRKEAVSAIRKDDRQRRQWSLTLFGVDTRDPGLYDLFVNVDRMTVDDAAGVICHAAGLERFQKTIASQKALDDLLLASEVRLILLDMAPLIEVTASDGAVTVKSEVHASQKRQLVRRIETAAGAVPGVRDVQVEVARSWPTTPYE